MTLNPAVLELLPAFIDVTNDTMALAVKDREFHKVAAEKAAAIRPRLVEKMARAGIIQPDQVKLAEAMLGDLSSSYGLVDTLVDKSIALGAQNEAKVAGVSGKAGTDPTALPAVEEKVPAHRMHKVAATRAAANGLGSIGRDPGRFPRR